MAYQPPPKLPNRSFALRLVFVLGVLFAAGLGAGGNVANFYIAQDYTERSLPSVDSTCLMNSLIASGVLWGVVYGLLLSTVLAACIGVISRVRCPFFMCLKTLLGAVASAALFWAAGGGVAMALAIISPDYFMPMTGISGGEMELMLREAWACGSPWGMLLGGAVSVVLASVMFNAKWQAYAESKKTSEPPKTI